MVGGGVIPGMSDYPAFALHVTEPTPIPVLITVPHAGRAYPESLLARMRNPGMTCLRLEDRHVDRLGAEIVRQTGGALLVAHAPRAAIDLNRDVHDMDWEMVQGGAPSGEAHRPHGARASGGLGLVPRRLGGLGDIWKGRFDAADVHARIEGIHRPYHAAISATLAMISARWGGALLIDLHSMPPLAPGPTGRCTELVLGDRFGGSCSGSLIASAFDHLARQDVLAAYNRPYAGGYVLDRHGAPMEGVHAIQIEVCRSLYLDASHREISDGLGPLATLLSGLVRVLADELIARVPSAGKSGEGWGLAAE